MLVPYTYRPFLPSSFPTAGVVLQVFSQKTNKYRKWYTIVIHQLAAVDSARRQSNPVSDSLPTSECPIIAQSESNFPVCPAGFTLVFYNWPTGASGHLCYESNSRWWIVDGNKPLPCLPFTQQRGSYSLCVCVCVHNAVWHNNNNNSDQSAGTCDHHYHQAIIIIIIADPAA